MERGSGLNSSLKGKHLAQCLAHNAVRVCCILLVNVHVYSQMEGILNYYRILKYIELCSYKNASE